MSVLQRTIRITVSSLLANLVAVLLNLQNPYAAGIIAILAVLNTRQKTFDRAKEYFISTVTAFTIATIIFLVFGYSIYSFAVYLAIYVPIAYYLKVDAGIAPCSVLVTHFWIAGSVALEWQLNGLAIMLIGLFFALMGNLWIPSRTPELEDLVTDIERQLRLILFLLEKQLLEAQGNQNRVKTELKELCVLIDRMDKLALIEYENGRFGENHKEYYIRYVQMRRHQYEILELMNEDLDDVLPNMEANKILASIFGETAEQLDERNTGVELLDQIGQLYRVYRDSSLPQTREEFESRAVLYNVLTDFEKFLALKRDFYQAYKQDVKEN